MTENGMIATDRQTKPNFSRNILDKIAILLNFAAHANASAVYAPSQLEKLQVVLTIVRNY